ncbi:MAG: tRNA pseudouridine(38-40) synthase TruA [Flavobacterium sp.]|uniref:tRNA pseudouridine(38-40) synthase TruA n=1 Tax=Flavobacterium sp. TaxID=239 RepID=UPI0022C08984|nr:tRNA pseudouridine(38-40) synthase TruA [Flavobacterium sp.]MCZ8196929.1 tRNA pseudouridine(38-40) synthase TruA [Flavobacterium sp.]
MRYFIQISYNGTNYHGWQQQPNASSVQETLNKSLSTVLNCKIDCMGAGRTDTGVHATQMYAHFDCDELQNTTSIIHKLNSFLPQDIVVHDLIQVHEDAHARFDATKRTYEYHIHSFKNAFFQNKSWYFHQKLNVDLMNQACKILFNHTDFQCFSKVHTDVNTFDCKIYEAFWKQENANLIFTISADRFLRNMVRAIVGTMVNVGLEKITLEEFQTIIESKDRNKAGFSVPAHGLYLTEIKYDYLK